PVDHAGKRNLAGVAMVIGIYALLLLVLLAISAAFRPAVLGNARCSLPRLSASYDERTATAFGLHNRQLAPPRLDADQRIVRDPASELGRRVFRSRLSRAVRLCGVLVMIRAVAQMTV